MGDCCLAFNLVLEIECSWKDLFQGIISPITLLNQVSLSAKTKGAFAPKFYEEHKSCPSTQFGRAIFLKFEASLIDTLYKGAIRVNT